MNAATNNVAPLTVEEQQVVDAVQAMFAALETCATAGGDPNRAFLHAVPPEMMAEARRQVPLLAFLGL